MNYLIVDDEPQARKLLQAYMAGMGNYHLIKMCESAMEAYEALHTHHIDLMFLDIKMPIVSGIDFLRSLKNPPMVIFTTAYPKYALDGFELNVIDYLLKPIALTRLMQALEKVQSRLRQPPRHANQGTVKHLFVKIDNKLVKLNLDDILLIEGMQNYVKLHFADKVLVASYTLKVLEDMLPGNAFLRAHRSYIVPVSAITAVNGNTIETDYRHIPIGVSYKADVMKYIGG